MDKGRVSVREVLGCGKGKRYGNDKDKDMIREGL